MKKYKSDIIFFCSLTVFIVIFYFLAVVVLPFFLGLAFAFVFNPVIKRIQKFIPNRNLAVTLFLILIIVFIGGSIWLFANQISNDFKRLNKAFITFAETNNEELDDAAKTIKSYIEKIYSPEDLKKKLSIEENIDSLNVNELLKDIDKDGIIKSLDTDTIKEALTTIGSFFTSNDEEKETSAGLNWFIIIISSIGYFIYIIYTFNYFDNKLQAYFGEKRFEKVNRVLTDIKKTFLSYFKQRSKIVFIYTVIFTTAFFIIGIPGALILGIIAGLLCFIPYLQYLVLIPISLGCLFLSIEQSNSFFIYFGIVLAVFIISSVFEELVLFPKIMKDVSAMNPAVMMVSISIWGYLLGLFGVLIALPLTSIILSYIKQVLLYGKKEINIQ